LQQHDEYDCTVKAFIYLAAHLPRDELLEPVMNEAFEQMVLGMKNMMAIATEHQAGKSFFDPHVDINGIEAALGRSSSQVAAVGVPLCEAEPDMFPCLVVVCGSALAFLKVSVCLYVCYLCNVIIFENLDVGRQFSHVRYICWQVKFTYECRRVNVNVTGAKLVENPHSHNCKNFYRQ